MSVLIFGHSNPDTDSIISAIALAHFLDDGEARAQGPPNKETIFVLEKFGLTVPKILENVAGQKVAIVDTTDLPQLPADIKEAEITRIVDHHKLSTLTSNEPINVDVRPWGCTATIIWSLYVDIFKKEVPKNIAGAMACAIMSDTALFKSPTTTKYDRQAVSELAKIAGIDDIEALGMEMLKVKSSIDNDSALDLIQRDFKSFHIGDKKVGIGQIELVDLSMIDPKLENIKAEMKKMKNEGEYWGVIMMVTDIMKEGSLILLETDDNERVARIFGCEITNNQAWIDGMMSRKKQVVPPLTTKL